MHIYSILTKVHVIILHVAITQTFLIFNAPAYASFYSYFSTVALDLKFCPKRWQRLLTLSLSLEISLVIEQNEQQIIILILC